MSDFNYRGWECYRDADRGDWIGTPPGYSGATDEPSVCVLAVEPTKEDLIDEIDSREYEQEQILTNRSLELEAKHHGLNETE